MPDESYYLTTNEAALAVVATAMKKARLSIDTLIINSFVAGLLFASGGMLHEWVQSGMTDLHQSNPAIISLLQGLVYPIGLFYVVILGVDLFNSNVLFFTVGVARGAVSLLDLAISWFVSWWFNLVGNIFVCYLFCKYSKITQNELFIKGSIDIVMEKNSFTFVETLLKAMAGNFYVCLAIYLQLMVKPLHVKFLMMVLPVFTFVAVGFTHSVADMFLLIMGSINGAPVPLRQSIWKVMLPGAIGNIIGGAFFGLLIPWYLHIVVVEKDIHLLRLPRYEYRDEQPEINQDSRVVRLKSHDTEVEATDDDDTEELDTRLDSEKFETTSGVSPRHSTANSSPASLYEPPQGMVSTGVQNLARMASGTSGLSRLTTHNSLSRRTTHRTNSHGRSPKNVFPVYGMGPPPERERSIASGKSSHPLEEDDEFESDSVRSYPKPPDEVESAEYIGSRLKRFITRQPSSKPVDEERDKR
ncbi:Transporter [[Candida] zeylanoides]